MSLSHLPIIVEHTQYDVYYYSESKKIYAVYNMSNRKDTIRNFRVKDNNQPISHKTAISELINNWG